MRSQIPIRDLAAKHRRGILDTSVIIDLERVEPSKLPDEPLVTAISMAELAVGPQAATSSTERAICQDRLQRSEAAFTPLPFDDGAARAYGRIYAEIAGRGRKPRGARALDLLIASIALDLDLPLYTRNAIDVEALKELIDIVAV